MYTPAKNTKRGILLLTAGWSSQVARRAHNPKVGGSNPSPATIIYAYMEHKDTKGFF